MTTKKLITVMVLMIALGATAALAGDMEWKFYGQLHSSINMLSNGEHSQIGLTSNTSRFGFKGMKPMNDDFSLIWQFENYVNIAQMDAQMNSEIDEYYDFEYDEYYYTYDGGHATKSTLATRNSYIGFQHVEYGKLFMGIHDTPFKVLGRKVTNFKDTIGDHRQMTFGADQRLEDLLAYVSPDMNGFGLFLAYQFDQNKGKLEVADPDAEFSGYTTFSGMASYAKDEIFLGLAVLKLGEGYADSYYDEDDEEVFGDAPMAIRFAGKYDAEQFGFSLLYQTIGTQYATVDDDGDDMFADETATTLGLEGVFKANEKYHVKAGYYMADPDTDFDDDDAKLMTFGVDRIFSKSVTVYFQYAGLSGGDMVSGDDLCLGMGNGFGGSVCGTSTWDDEAEAYDTNNPSGFSVGAVVKF